MRIVCSLFGHITSGDKHSGAEYMIVSAPYGDGVDRLHCQVHADCARCGSRFRVGAIHLPMHKIITIDLQRIIERREKILRGCSKGGDHDWRLMSFGGSVCAKCDKWEFVPLEFTRPPWEVMGCGIP